MGEYWHFCSSVQRHRCLQLHYTVIIQLDGKKLYQFVAVIWTQLWYFSDLLFMSINMLHLRSSAHCSIYSEDNINVIGVNSLAQANKQTTHKLMTRIKSLFWKLSVAWARVDKMHVDPFEISITLSILCARSALLHCQSCALAPIKQTNISSLIIFNYFYSIKFNFLKLFRWCIGSLWSSSRFI